MSEKAALYAALAKAQAEYAPVERSAVNPHFKSKYAPLDKVLDAITPAMNKHGLCRGWRQDMDGENVTVTAFIGHGESGEEVVSSLTWGVPENIQHLGAAITYMRRYTMEALAGVAADSDDDGNGASDTAPKPKAKPKPTMKQALNAGAATLASEIDGKFDAWLERHGITGEQFRSDLIDFAEIRIPKMVAGPFSSWEPWIQDKARELRKNIEASDANNQTFTEADDTRSDSR